MKLLLLAAFLALTTSAFAKAASPKWEIVVTEADDKSHPKTYPFSGEAQAVTVAAKGWTCNANKHASDLVEFGVVCTHSSGAVAALAVGCNDSAHPGELGLGNLDSKSGTSISIKCNAAKVSGSDKKKSK